MKQKKPATAEEMLEYTDNDPVKAQRLAELTNQINSSTEKGISQTLTMASLIDQAKAACKTESDHAKYKKILRDVHLTSDEANELIVLSRKKRLTKAQRDRVMDISLNQAERSLLAQGVGDGAHRASIWRKPH